MKRLLNLIPGIGWLRIVARFLAAPIRAIWRWMTADWRNGPLLIFGLTVAVHLFLIDPRLRGARDKAQADLVGEQKAHAETVLNYRRAAWQAAEDQAKELARVRAADRTTNERLSHDYEARIADLRARAAALAGRLRSDAASGTDPGLSGAGGMPGTVAAPGRTVEAPGDHGLPVAGTDAGTCTPMTIEERLTASEQAVQLDALIDGVLAQAKVRNAQ